MTARLHRLRRGRNHRRWARAALQGSRYANPSDRNGSPGCGTGWHCGPLFFGQKCARGGGTCGSEQSRPKHPRQRIGDRPIPYSRFPRCRGIANCGEVRAIAQLRRGAGRTPSTSYRTWAASFSSPEFGGAAEFRGAKDPSADEGVRLTQSIIHSNDLSTTPLRRGSSRPERGPRYQRGGV